MTKSLPQIGRPFSKLTPEIVGELQRLHKVFRFNRSLVARNLGIKNKTLIHHLAYGAKDYTQSPRPIGGIRYASLATKTNEPRDQQVA